MKQVRSAIRCRTISFPSKPLLRAFGCLTKLQLRATQRASLQWDTMVQTVNINLTKESLLQSCSECEQLLHQHFTLYPLT